MLTQIRRIKNLGVFGDYSRSPEVPDLNRYNLIYGENGSGKTTLSRLLACLEEGEHADHPDLEFTIETQSGALARGTRYGRKVRAFNSDFIEANIGGLDGPLRHILILGEENKLVAAEIKSEIDTRDARLRRIAELDASVARLETERGRLFSGIAKTIGEATSGATLRSYRKPDAEGAFRNLTGGEQLSDEELALHHTTVHQDMMPSIVQIQEPSVRIGVDEPESAIAVARGTALRACDLAAESAQSNVLERLLGKPDIASWVEQGISLHGRHSSETCEFCARPMPAERLAALADHFSAEDQRLKARIERERDRLSAAIEGLNRIIAPDRLALYSELRDSYDAATKELDAALIELKARLGEVDATLTSKLANRTRSYEATASSDTARLAQSFTNLNAIIERHNEKTAGFDSARSTSRDAIEAHYLRSIKGQADELAERIVAATVEIALLRNGGEGLPDVRGIAALNASIAAKQAQVSNEHKGGENLTRDLCQFLGRTDLRFDSGVDGYHVMRRGRPARRLSEGEKTAIAFLYFLVQLTDRDFDMSEGVVVIDDPISSLDASAIYQAFSFLKNRTQGAKQLFILTHNFEFLRLVINWLQNIPGPRAEKTFTMVLCSETEEGRSARLAPLDRLLIDHATEYHYLFKVLHTFKSDGTILGCYHVPNIARKVLETFLDFHVPSNRSLHRKLEETDFDPHKKTAIYKFANDLSHHTGKSFDPALVAETQKNTIYLLEMIEAVAPLHYGGLKALAEA